ncbi:unnamed protein product [marine sediment metagenome]|uniref:HTH cro/C1-type domain-containing protein n=1 Tax=marine sediment metagenome TaxID=412755 RepID=X1AHF5_9ZZZZ
MSERPAKVVFKNNLRNIRITKNPRMSQWVLALKSNVPQSKISLIENYLVNPTQEEKESLSLALNISVLTIFFDGQLKRRER